VERSPEATTRMAIGTQIAETPPTLKAAVWMWAKVLGGIDLARSPIHWRHGIRWSRWRLI
jgi:hypothetical protein